MYVTSSEFISRIGIQETIELTNLDDPSANTVNSDRLEAILSDASSEIDGYLATRYQVPLTAIPGVIKTYCIDIAWYRLAHNNAPEAFSERYKQAIARLKDIEKGQMLLLDVDGHPVAQRKVTNQLIDERGNPLDDFTTIYQPGGVQIFSHDSLSLY